ncbi:MAG: hypothetical protein AMXMBFR20_15250 [Planctomycetia bacterium]
MMLSGVECELEGHQDQLPQARARSKISYMEPNLTLAHEVPSDEHSKTLDPLPC